MKTFLRFLIAFLAITGAVVLSTVFLGIEFDRENFWDHHGLLFLVFITFVPRLTLLFSSVAFGGLFWWLGWIFAPRILVAVLATLAYWHQNPILVAIAWLIALSGESSEKYVVARRSRQQWDRARGFDSARWVDAETSGRKQ